MFTKAHQAISLYNEIIFAPHKKFAPPANENLAELKTLSKDTTALNDSKAALLSKRLEFILLKLKLDSEELISLLQN